MIAWSIEAAKAVGCFDLILVSTDDSEIAKVAERYGATVPFMRPPELSDDYVGTTAVVEHSVNWVSEHSQTPSESCCIYATAPIIHTEDIKRGLDTFLNTCAAYAFPITSYAVPIQRAIRVTQDRRVTMFYPELFDSRSQDLEEAWHDAGQFYWGQASAWREHKPIFSEDSVALPIPRYRVQDIDTLEDWQQAELMFKALQSEN